MAAYPDLDQETLLDTLEGASGLKEMLGAITRAYIARAVITARLAICAGATAIATRCKRSSA